MRKLISLTFLFILIFSSLTTNAQYDPSKVCRIEDGKIVFLLNLKWTGKEKKEICELFDLDSVLISRAYKGESLISFEGENWKVTRQKNNIIELSKAYQSKSAKDIVKTDDLFLLIDKWMNFSGSVEEESEVYGLNSFKIAYTFSYRNSAWFFLAGNKTASKVFISGSFNNWNTSQDPMKQVESGWTADLKLRPGKYTYKFIVDGKWIPDPYNNLREDDGAGGYNSVIYCPNHTFQMKGSDGARKVVVTGNFTNWNPKGLEMQKTSDGWSLPIYLRDGTYAYKFIVDNNWYTDPANNMTRRDNRGNVNSIISIGEPYLFKLEGFTNVNKVILSGNFNGWNVNDLVMDKTEKGWQIAYVLPAGNYEYKFIADGKWMTDPSNPFSTGSGIYENSFISLKANHLFSLDKYPDAKNVILSGSFNGWNKNDYRMKKQGDKWIFPLFLRPGKYTYKFIVDGNWIIDPGNDLYEQNEFGTYNSVLWIEP